MVSRGCGGSGTSSTTTPIHVARPATRASTAPPVRRWTPPASTIRCHEFPHDHSASSRRARRERSPNTSGMERCRSTRGLIRSRMSASCAGPCTRRNHDICRSGVGPMRTPAGAVPAMVCAFAHTSSRSRPAKPVNASSADRSASMPRNSATASATGSGPASAHSRSSGRKVSGVRSPGAPGTSTIGCRGARGGWGIRGICGCGDSRVTQADPRRGASATSAPCPRSGARPCAATCPAWARR